MNVIYRLILVSILQISIPSQDVNANEMKYNLAGNKMTSEERKELNIKILENNKVCLRLVF